MSTEPRVVFRYFRWLFPVRCELSLYHYLDIPPVTGRIAKAERRDLKECSSRPKPAFPLGADAARQQAKGYVITCPFTVSFTSRFSDALSIQSYEARPQAETLEVVLRSTAGPST